MEADDMDAIQELFNKYCDKDGLMTKAALAAMPPFSDMLVRTFDCEFRYRTAFNRPRKN